MGISGGNFIIAETGALCLVTSGGNGRMVTALPRVHVALVGIEGDRHCRLRHPHADSAAAPPARR